MSALTLPSWDACVAAAALILAAGSWLSAPERGIPRSRLLELWPALLLGGFAGAHLYFLLAASPVPLAERGALEWLDVLNGTAVQGGVWGGFIVVWAYAAARSLSAWDLMDVLAPAGAAAHAVARLGCLSARCCYGKPAAWLTPLFGSPLHPAPLYESVLLLLLAGRLLRMLKEHAPRGTICLTYLGGYGAIRFTVEFFRGDDVNRLHAGLTHAQYMALAMIAAALALRAAAIRNLSRN